LFNTRYADSPTNAIIRRSDEPIDDGHVGMLSLQESIIASGSSMGPFKHAQICRPELVVGKQKITAEKTSLTSYLLVRRSALLSSTILSSRCWEVCMLENVRNWRTAASVWGVWAHTLFGVRNRRQLPEILIWEGLRRS